MKTKTNKKNNTPTFLVWQRAARKFLELEKIDQIRIVKEMYKEMLDAFDEKEAEAKRIIDGMSELLDKYHVKEFTWDETPEVMEAQATAIGEITRLNKRFDSKWGDSVDAHNEIIAEIEAEYKKLMKLTRSFSVYEELLKKTT